VAHVAGLGSLAMIIATAIFLPSTREVAKEREKLHKEQGNNQGKDINGDAAQNGTKASSNNGTDSVDMMDILKVLRRPAIRNILVLKVIAGLGFAVYHSSFATVAQEKFLLSAQDSGLVISYSAGLAILVNTFVVGWATNKYSDRAVVKWSLLLLSIAFFVVSFVSSLYELLVLMVPMTLASTSMYTVVTSILTKSVARSETGTVIGLDHATRSLSSVVAPTLGGYMFLYLGYPALGLFGSAALGLSFVLWDMV